MARTVHTIAIAAVIILAGCAGGGGGYGGGDAGGGYSAGGGDGASGAGDGNIGVSAGGAQDANAFRDNVRNGYVPQPTDIAYEGLFHDYYFDTGAARECNALFCPSYSRARSTDPLSGRAEPYVSVGLNSGIPKDAFDRQRLNLVVVVDTSGSMSESFRRYHYDDGKRPASPETTSKMSAAKSALRTMVGHLGPDDSFGLVAYDDNARVLRELRRVDSARRAINGSIDRLRAGGSTNLDAGMRTARLLAEERARDERAETRVIYLTDAMPNTGGTGAGWLESRLDAQAQAGIHSTFVGVGVDFNSRLVEAISSQEGGNYYAVHSAESFRERMTDGFEFMVSPLAYDLTVSVRSTAYDIEAVYGSPEAEASTGRVMHVDTLFPSRRTEGRTEGGVILLGLERTGPGDSLLLEASYETPDGQRRSVTKRVTFPPGDGEFYDNSGVRKAVVLSRYADLMRNWAAYERAQVDGASPEWPHDGIDHHDPAALGQWEQQSVSLRVSPIYRPRIAAFADEFGREMSALKAVRMRKDLRILEQLAAVGSESSGVRERDVTDDRGWRTPRYDEGLAPSAAASVP